MGKRKVTIEQEDEICALYVDGSETNTQIAERYGVDNSTISNIAKRNGLALKSPKRGKVVYKTCPHCRRTVKEEEAKFCCFCGANIQTELETIIEKQQKLARCVLHLSENMRDEAHAIITETINYLKRQKGVK